MPRVSHGCLRCRQRRVKCDEGRPSCMRCITRDELCIGYRDEFDLVFRHETGRSGVNSFVTNAKAGTGTAKSTSRGSEHTASDSENATRIRTRARSRSVGSSPAVSTPRLQTVRNPPVNATSAIPWLKTCTTTTSSRWSPLEESAVSNFFAKYVVYPCTSSSTPGFLEHLPCLFNEVNVDSRYALRWAVQAAAFADIARDQQSDSVLGQQVLECYGRALSALSQSLSEKGKVPDDCDLMTVVVLDIFETLFMGGAHRGAHAQGMAHILRLRGHEQFNSPRGWSLFRLAHHRLQKEQLAFQLSPMPEADALLDRLNDNSSSMRLEKDALQISRLCQRARNLTQRLSTDGDSMAVQEVFDIIREMHMLDKAAVSWRTGSQWSFRTIKRSELTGNDELIATFAETIELHPDVWNAYEWNYQRTARILMHEQLLSCLRRAAASADLHDTGDAALLSPLEVESMTIIRSLADKILATVPQSLGDVDSEGRVLVSNDGVSGPPRSRAIGAYLLLWPIKITKSPQSSVSDEQRALAAQVFERIREYTGMKAHLGQLSEI